MDRVSSDLGEHPRPPGREPAGGGARGDRARDRGRDRERRAVRSFHKLRARKSGSQRHVDFHLQLRAQTTLGEAHKISDDLEARIGRTLPNTDVLIHLEDDRSLKDEGEDRRWPGLALRAL